jgi:hypothetical protein
MTQHSRPQSEQHIEMEAPARTGTEMQPLPDAIEAVIAPAAIERALAIYQPTAAARSIGISAGQKNPDAAYLRNGGPRPAGRTAVDCRRPARLKAIERDHAIKSAHGAEASSS